MHLKALSFDDNEFEVWDDAKIKAGDKWKVTIEKVLIECKIAILIVSTPFLASDFIHQ